MGNSENILCDSVSKTGQTDQKEIVDHYQAIFVKVIHDCEYISQFFNSSSCWYSIHLLQLTSQPFTIILSIDGHQKQFI